MKKPKKKLSELEKAVLRARRSMPCPTGTKIFRDKKKEANKKRCRRAK